MRCVCCGMPAPATLCEECSAAILLSWQHPTLSLATPAWIGVAIAAARPDRREIRYRP
jgi:hypothetical protein